MGTIKGVANHKKKSREVILLRCTDTSGKEIHIPSDQVIFKSIVHPSDPFLLGSLRSHKNLKPNSAVQTWILFIAILSTFKSQCYPYSCSGKRGSYVAERAFSRGGVCFYNRCDHLVPHWLGRCQYNVTNCDNRSSHDLPALSLCGST